jgi:serine/threonine protein kinase
MDGADLTDVAHSPIDILVHKWTTLIYGGRKYTRDEVETGAVEFPIRAPHRTYSPLSETEVVELEQATRKLAALAAKGPKSQGTQYGQTLKEEVAQIGARLRKSPPPRMGDVVAGAKLIGVLGKGGFGTVYDAVEHATGERRAVKVFDFDRLTVGLTMYHFRKGVRVMQLLNRVENKPESVVRLHETEPAMLAFSMDLLDGQDLSNIAERGWDITKKLEVFRTICHGVKFAHEHGVIHRDIKPPNIVMNRGRPVLTDFDIADLLFAKTQSSHAAGTATYAAPEELSGRGRRKASGDVFSLGRLLLFLLLERDPEIHGTDMGTIPKDYPALAGVIETSTRFEPKDRYQSVTELLRALPEDARVPAPQRSPGRRWSRQVTAAVVAGGFGVLAAIVAGLMPSCSNALGSKASSAGSGTSAQPKPPTPSTGH